MVLLRMNGTGSEKIIDRSDELYSMQLFTRQGWALLYMHSLAMDSAISLASLLFFFI